MAQKLPAGVTRGRPIVQYAISVFPEVAQRTYIPGRLLFDPLFFLRVQGFTLLTCDHILQGPEFNPCRPRGYVKVGQ